MTPPEIHDLDGSPAHDRLAFAAPVGGEAIVIPADTRNDAAAATPDAPPVLPGRANAVLVALAVSAFLMVTNEASILGLIQPMSEDLGLSLSRLGLMGTMFAGSVMVWTLPLAFLTTRMVRRWVIVAALVTFTVGTAVAALADSFAVVMASRFITGAAHALFWATVTPAAAGMFPLARRGKSVSRLLLGASAAGVVGVPGATFLAERGDWHLPFQILTVAGALMAVVVALMMPSFRTSQATVVRGEFPMPRRFARILAVTFSMTFGMTITWAYFSPYFTTVAGFSLSTVPMLLGLGGVAGVTTTWLVARYLDRWPVLMVAVGFTAITVMFALLVFGGHLKPVAIIALVLQGFGGSVLVASIVNWVLRHSPWTADIGNGVYAITFNTGNALGAAIGSFLLARVGVDVLPMVSLGVVTVGLVLVLTVPGSRGRAATAAKTRAALGR